MWKQVHDMNVTAICVYFRLWVGSTVIGTVAVDGWSVTSGTARTGTGRCGESFEMTLSCDR